MSKQKAQRKGWHPEQIKCAIRMRGTTLGKLATDNGMSESACRQALIRSSPAAEAVISSFLNVPLHQLWPDRYAPNGRRYAALHVRVQDNHERNDSHRLIGGGR
jgi:Ner family transcriptional regulator